MKQKVYNDSFSDFLNFYKKLNNIDLEKLEKIAFCQKNETIEYPFEKIEKYDKNIVIVNDDNFSFLYHDNLNFLKEVFAKVTIVNGVKNEIIPDDTDIVFIVGGYIETNEAYSKIENSNYFKTIPYYFTLFLCDLPLPKL